MRFYKRDPDAALAGMMELTLQERGAYNTIIDALYSRDGVLPDDDHLLRSLMACHGNEWRAVKLKLIQRGKIRVENGFIKARRVDSVLEEAAEVSASQRARVKKRWDANDSQTMSKRQNGKKSARKKSQKSGASSGNAPETADKRAGNAPEKSEKVNEINGGRYTINTHSYNKDSEDSEESSPNRAYRFNGADFERFWEAWDIPGTKRGRKAAERKFKIATRSVTPERLVEGVQAYMAFCRADKRETRYIKHPATWLHQGCWDDDLTTPPPTGGEPNEKAGRRHPGTTKADRAKAAILRGLDAGDDRHAANGSRGGEGPGRPGLRLVSDAQTVRQGAREP